MTILTPDKPPLPFGSALSEGVPYRPAHILVVDDEPRIAQTVRDLLVRGGYQISIALGGRDAVEQIEHSLDSADGDTPFDLVILDINMPLVTGLDVLHWIRSNDRLATLRVIMLSSVADKPVVVEALTVGADDYLTKPYLTQELLARVQTALRTQQLEKRLQRQSHQLAMLNTISNTLTRTLEAKDLLDLVPAGIHDLLDVEMTAVFTAEKGQSQLRCTHLHAGSESRLRAETLPVVPLEQGIIGRAFSTRTTQVVNHPATDERFNALSDAPTGVALRSLIAAPIYLRGHPVGVIAAYNKRQSGFETSEADLFVSLAGTITQALDQSWLVQMLRNRQQELLQSRNQLQSLIDGILHPIYTINADWNVVAVNLAKAQQEQQSAEALRGRRCFETFFERTTPCDHCKVPRVMGQDAAPQQWQVRQSSGHSLLPLEWEVNAFPVPSTRDDDVRAVIMWQDRTEERRMESSLHQAARLSAVGQLAAGVAHEINNPLTVVKTGAEMLRDVVQPDSDDADLVEMIAQAADRASKVVRGLLDFARQSRYEFTAGNLAQSLLDAVDLVAYQMRKANIVVHTDFPDEVAWIVASWEHLKTVWVNLLINARDALEQRSDDRRIELAILPAPAGDHVKVLFHDNGVGITEAQQALVFLPFFTTKDPGKGTGLGLATSHQIIERHGGEITVSSTPGVGTTFQIVLPVGERALLDERPEPIPEDLDDVP